MNQDKYIPAGKDFLPENPITLEDAIYKLDDGLYIEVKGTHLRLEETDYWINLNKRATSDDLMTLKKIFVKGKMAKAKEIREALGGDEFKVGW